MDLFASLPNLITLARLCLVPLSVWLIAEQHWEAAFAVFVVAGLSDALDGWLAKTYGLETELGAYLDPLADKALLVSIYVALTLARHLPVPLAILVVSRDILIIGAVLIAGLMGKPVEIRPLFVSKLNTVAQIGLAGLVLGMKALGTAPGAGLDVAIWFTAGLTFASAAAYLRQWLRHMGA